MPGDEDPVDAAASDMLRSGSRFAAFAAARLPMEERRVLHPIPIAPDNSILPEAAAAAPACLAPTRQLLPAAVAARQAELTAVRAALGITTAVRAALGITAGKSTFVRPARTEYIVEKNSDALQMRMSISDLLGRLCLQRSVSRPTAAIATETAAVLSAPAPRVCTSSAASLTGASSILLSAAGAALRPAARVRGRPLAQVGLALFGVVRPFSGSTALQASLRRGRVDAMNSVASPFNRVDRLCSCRA